MARDDGREATTFYPSTDLKRQIKIAAAGQGITMDAWIRQACASKLEGIRNIKTVADFSIAPLTSEREETIRDLNKEDESAD